MKPFIDFEYAVHNSKEEDQKIVEFREEHDPDNWSYAVTWIVFVISFILAIVVSCFISVLIF
jgi:hypothetical protein